MALNVPAGSDTTSDNAATTSGKHLRVRIADELVSALQASLKIANSHRNNPATASSPDKSSTQTSYGAELKAAEESLEAVRALLKGSSAAVRAEVVQHLHQHTDIASLICARLLHPGFGHEGDQLCRLLYQWYSSGFRPLQSLVLQFVPALAWSLLRRHFHREDYAGVLAVLLGIYNFAVDDIRQKRDPHLWRDVYFPDLAKPSLYHRPVVGSSDTAHGKAKDSVADKDFSIQERLRPIKQISTRSLLRIVRVALLRYDHDISVMSNASQQQYCALAARLADVGLSVSPSSDPLREALSPLEWEWGWDTVRGARLQYAVDAKLLQAMLRGVGFCLALPWTHDIAVVAVHQIHARALQDMYADVILAASNLVEEMESQLDSQP